ncbi:hypothetical protein V8C35DRAFT_142944 [Trichoderma chlorosporum]
MPGYGWHLLVYYFFLLLFSMPFLFHLPSFVVDTPLQRFKEKAFTKSEDKDPKRKKGGGQASDSFLHPFFILTKFYDVCPKGEVFEVESCLFLLCLLMLVPTISELVVEFTITVLFNQNLTKKKREELRRN